MSVQDADAKIVRLEPRPNLPHGALRDASRPLELWAGLECSHVTIDGAIRDQLHETGHLIRDDDLDRIADLGIRTIRYPLLWAHAEGGGPTLADHGRRLARLEALGITPIAGFLHHGAGPDGLLPTDPGFAERLADFAETVVRRFPSLRHFTPINEPVTTARIACLYGQWEPHARDTPTFLRHVAGYATATAEVMRRIRDLRPAAMLIQTEDVGRVFATEALAEQAAYENERRFLGFDLLCGRVGQGHPFWTELVDAGVAVDTLAALAAAPCPPDIMGIDQYLTSDRFLDHRLERYPHEPVGGNGRQAYVDVAAVRVPELQPQVGLLARLREVKARYGLPIAVTEVHNGCTREEQLRWLMEAWQAATAARQDGIDVRAITVWSLFGTYDWNSMLRERRGFYESGAFDVRHDPPHPTVIAKAAASLARHGRFDHPLLARAGWWRDCASDPVALLRVEGPIKVLDPVLACCARRRIDTLAPGGGATRPEVPEWGALTLSVEGEVCRFSFHSTGATDALQIDADIDADMIAATDAVLDLAVDGLTGHFTLTELGPHCQYRLLPVDLSQADEIGPRRKERYARGGG
ncbi:family 1 glycosylhydrolase [Tabrizicola sp. BL-A-41-H6]|uniref:family 1 glycosylhydrolase n=1 Tax=Tabrizicola sp. BL-A-41-H6 TaxID=3421107 RepID=UPI003D6674CE